MAQPNTSAITKEFDYTKCIYTQTLRSTDLMDDREELQRVKRN